MKRRHAMIRLEIESIAFLNHSKSSEGPDVAIFAQKGRINVIAGQFEV